MNSAFEFLSYLIFFLSKYRARDLVAMDTNGFSDPYCELKVNGECKYKSSVKKKTLHPLWEENAIMGMPRPGETFDVVSSRVNR